MVALARNEKEFSLFSFILGKYQNTIFRCFHLFQGSIRIQFFVVFIYFREVSEYNLSLFSFISGKYQNTIFRCFHLFQGSIRIQFFVVFIYFREVSEYNFEDSLDFVNMHLLLVAFDPHSLLDHINNFISVTSLKFT